MSETRKKRATTSVAIPKELINRAMLVGIGLDSAEKDLAAQREAENQA